MDIGAVKENWGLVITDVLNAHPLCVLMGG